MAKLADELKKYIKQDKRTKTKSLSVRLREDRYEALDIISKATGKTKSEIVEEALEKEGLFNEKFIEEMKKLLQGGSDENASNNEKENIT